MVLVKASIEKACPQALEQLLESRQWKQKRPTLHEREFNGNPCKPGDGMKMFSLLKKGGRTAHLSLVHQP
ncbi:hypothetical protein Baya_12447 [Bagarius yarrelli]|uniref:Uncharacterized protein n=1 Tax=Bagarius yarrelli TaxID=175774 RepID=A0A556V381_BAGYA|nr:hypothetical protein Baya_12447 [Bagarius yarrelli]